MPTPITNKNAILAIFPQIVMTALCNKAIKADEKNIIFADVITHAFVPLIFADGEDKLKFKLITYELLSYIISLVCLAYERTKGVKIDEVQQSVILSIISKEIPIDDDITETISSVKDLLKVAPKSCAMIKNLIIGYKIN